eukprot:symbB.v1.2.028969.t3/scaffold3123.1/size63075/7
MTTLQGTGGTSPATCEISLVLPNGETRKIALPGEATLEDLLREVKAAVPGLRLPCLKCEEQQEQWPRLEARTHGMSRQAFNDSLRQATTGTKNKKRGRQAHGRGKGGKANSKGVPESKKESTTSESADPVMHQAPMLEMSLAAEPGIKLWRVCRGLSIAGRVSATSNPSMDQGPNHVIARDVNGKRLPTNDEHSFNPNSFSFAPDATSTASAFPVVVEDFEEAFTKRLQSGLLRLRDLASVAPLLDWEKPELPKMLMGRLKSLLEGSCEAWCKAAACKQEDELLCARVLIRHVYGGLPLDERLRICRELLPPEKKDRKARVAVDRGEDFLKNSFTGLMKLSVEELRNPLSICFKNEDSGVFFLSVATVWTMEFEFGGGIPLSLHNLWVSILMLLMLAWLLQVAYRIFKAHRIHWRMRRSDMGPLFLDGMSLYTTDLQEIIRQHFNQLLRIRPTVPARDIAKVKILAHLQPESLQCSKVVDVSSMVSVTKLRLVFKVDSLQPFKVQLFWGQRCHDLLLQLADNVDVDVNWNERKQLPAGNGQEVTIVEDWSSISLDEEAASSERIPLIICLWTPSEVMRMLTFAEVHGAHDGDLPIEVMQQVVLTSGVARKILGIFGTEESEEEAGNECMVCFDRRRNVIVLPCRHCSVCLSCLRSMRDERCPLCRSTFSAYLLLPLQTGQVAEDYGGPRRDFFCMIGCRLCSDLKALWRRLPTGALAPVPDVVAETSPKDTLAGLDEVEEAYRASGRAAGLALKYGDVLGEEIAGFFVYQVARDDTVSLEELQRQIAESEGSDDIRASRRLLP